MSSTNARVELALSAIGMTYRGRIIFKARAFLLVLLGIALALAGCGGHSTLDLKLTDSVSKGWVWGATINIQDRSVTKYFQSDRGPVPLLIPGLSAGQWMLRVDAPNYEPIATPVTLRRGVNHLSHPLAMRGVEIPGLASWVVFEGAQGGDIVGQLRPMAPGGAPILNHPCLDIWVGALVSLEVKNGVPVVREADSGWSRGEELFRGQVSWTWDPAPETAFRYSVRIPGATMRGARGPYLIVDYLIVVPDPRKITGSKIARKVASIWSAHGPFEAIGPKLNAEGDRLHWYLATSANVRAP